MEVFFLWIVFAVVVGIIAGNRGRSGFGWFLLACIISPLIAGILVLALGAPKVDPSSDGAHKKCPSCAEWVKKEAVKCKHCGEALLPPSAAVGEIDAPVRPSQGSVSLGRSAGSFYARNKTAVVVGLLLFTLWLVFRWTTP